MDLVRVCEIGTIGEAAIDRPALIRRAPSTSTRLRSVLGRLQSRQEPRSTPAASGGRLN